MGERRGTKALELWCRRLTEGYPGVDVTNMTTSWRDGLAFCAIIHHFRPELIDFDKLNKSDVYYNNDLAFRTAERHLGIPALLDASDMALYEVPDRLSILTYLSQFYQVFGAQDSPHRLKRPSTATDKSPISKTSGPPPKMAHVVGVPKRDPCSACRLPVFLAERLTIPGVDGNGQKRVYHRTCLRCARCKSQLTPGSFYETEVDGEYCCETCPDEETLDDAIDNVPAVVAESSQGSIANRLAFFENDGKKVLQKSLSDEEKSQSLKKITETQKSAYKQNPALSKFMSHLMDSNEVVASTSSRSPASEDNSRRSSCSANSTTGTLAIDDDSSDEVTPELPTSLPPDITAKTVENEKAMHSQTYKSTMTLSLDRENNSKSEQEAAQQITSDKPIENRTNEQIEQIEQVSNTTSSLSSPSFDQKTTTIDSRSTDTINVTKDISDTDAKMRTSQIDNSVPLTSSLTTPPLSETIPISNDEEKFNDEISQTNRSSMVRARLHQFEIMSNSNSPFSSISSSVNKEELMTTSSISRSSSSASNSNKIPEDKKSQPISIATTENVVTQPLETEVPKIVDKNHEIITNDSIKQTTTKTDEEETQDASCPMPKELGIEKNSETEEDRKEPAKSFNDAVPSRKASSVNVDEEYPEDLNPFKSDDENQELEGGKEKKQTTVVKRELDSSRRASKDENRKSLNPFDSSDDENADGTRQKVKPPRPPPPKITKSSNPFDSEDDEVDDSSMTSADTPKRRPVPTPRSYANSSQNTTPEPTPRLSRQNYGATSLSNIDDQYSSSSSLLATPSTGVHSSTENLRRGIDIRGSSHSIGSSTGSLSGGKYRKGKKAPLPPTIASNTVKELFPTPPHENHKVSPQSRKKRPAPAPPSVAVAEKKLSSPVSDKIDSIDRSATTVSELPHTDDVKIAEDKLSDEEKLKDAVEATDATETDGTGKPIRRLISVDASLLDDSFTSSDSRPIEEDTVVYRRTIAPLIIENSADEEEEIPESHDRQLEKLKDNKEAKNRNRQSQISLSNSGEENDPLFNKSIHGKWKRRKGPAPALPVPPRKVLQMLPLQEIRHELEIIEVQQQGLEKQGVTLEKMIRERCEGTEDESKEDPSKSPAAGNSKEVEDLILQLFELVNEKNELFRRQAELMYLRRQHRLEQEQADLEYEIRVLMAQPERNKTDSDKAREEALIARLVEVVQLRNEVIECLEMDRLREAEEDMSIKLRLEMHAAKRDEELSQQTPTKLSKKEKKRLKEVKKLGKSKKLDADKDADESELAAEKKDKKKKKNILSSVIPFK